MQDPEVINQTLGNENENNEPYVPKKPRVVWSVDLHQKFVDAYNQLGIHGNCATPKKILEHMNVEGLTRENVASHLQKYRLYLKRISSVAAQSRAPSSGVIDPYMRMSSFNKVGDFQTRSSNQERLPNLSISSYQTGSLLNRLNTPNSTITKFNLGLMQPKPMEVNQLPESTSITPYNSNLNGNSINNSISSAQNEGVLGNWGFETFNRSPLVSNGVLQSISPLGGNILNAPFDFSSSNVMAMPNYDSKGDGLLANFKKNNDMLPVNCAIGPFGHILDQNKTMYQRKTVFPFQGSSSLSYMMKRDANEDVALEMKAKPNTDNSMEQWRTHSNNLDALLINYTTKGEE